MGASLARLEDERALPLARIIASVTVQAAFLGVGSDGSLRGRRWARQRARPSREYDGQDEKDSCFRTHFFNQLIILSTRERGNNPALTLPASP